LELDRWLGLLDDVGFRKVVAVVLVKTPWSTREADVN
jgi:hypothetical protein